MGAPVSARWACVALGCLVALHCVARLSGSRPGPARAGLRRDTEGAHCAMALAMAGMFSPIGDPVPALVWIAVFSGFAMWFGRLAWRARSAPPTPSYQPLTGGPQPYQHLHHIVANLAMIFMVAAMPLRGFLAGNPAMAGMARGGPGGAPFPLTLVVVISSVGLMCYFLLFVGWSVVRLTRLSAVGVGDAVSSGRGLPARLMLSPRLAICCQGLMGLGMAYMFALMR